MDKLMLILPEVTLFVTTCIVMILGLSPAYGARRLCQWVSGIGLFFAGTLALPAIAGEPTAEALGAAPALFPTLMPYAKSLISIVGILLVMLMSGTVDREAEADIASGKTRFNPLLLNRAEFYAFFLFSLTGLMLCTSAPTLIWLFLALELTSLPTYIMVTISTRGTKSQEAGVKYFFLGALGAAVFLYGFAMLYGAAGSTDLTEIAAALRAQELAGGLSPIAIAGLVISVIGLCFKIAAVPMHFYAADVYQGAASPVSAFLAFVPKTAGFIALILVLGVAGWPHGGEFRQLPDAVHWLLWILAAATMTAGNTLALLQSSVKRMLAYSSIAHSGYMLVALMAGPGTSGKFWDDGIAAVLFYLLCYGVMNLGVFAVLAALERGKSHEEVDDIEDLRGLNKTHPHLAAVMLLCCLSLLGFPPLIGFVGKIGLFTSAISTGKADMFALAVIMGINSAIAAVYYLRLVATSYLDSRDESDEPSPVRSSPFGQRTVAALASAGGVVVLLFFASSLLDASRHAAIYAQPAADPDAAPLELDGHDGEHGHAESPADEPAVPVADAR